MHICANVFTGASNAEAGIGLICACLPAVNALYVRAVRGSSYFQQSEDKQANSKQGLSRHGEIMLTRSFQVDSSSVNYESSNFATDEAELVKHPQSTLAYKSSQSDSIC
jgi:hypothetical protein